MFNNITPVGDFLYRVHDTPSGIDDAMDYSYCSNTETYCYRYKIIRGTPCGVWIQHGQSRKFVLLDASKKFACETVESAIESFKARKARQLRIMEARIRSIKETVANIDKQGHSDVMNTRSLLKFVALK